VELVCPRDRTPLRDGVCEQGHEYPLVDGVPVLLVDEEAPTHAACGRMEELPPPGEGIDPFVQEVIGATCGRLYEHLIADLPDYPIPELRLPPGEGRTFLEVGSNWGRWCVAAARRGYVATGIDPSLKGVQAARRVAEQLGVDAEYVVGDARRLPFADASFDVVFSYSVFQHFSKRDALAAFDEIGRVLAPGGESLVQLANLYGARSLWNQARERRFREPRTLFDVRYWGPLELKRELGRRIGPTRLSVDGFLTLNPQPTDLALLPARYRAVVRTSEALRRAARFVPPLTYVADSIYARSRRGELRSR
jgi:SAM-dependent methyltransferase